MIKIAIDGVFFQLSNSGICRVWQTVLERLAAIEAVDVVLLDRGRAPRIEGIRSIPFPSYTSKYTAQDSILIDEICKLEAVDVFFSTYYTTPLSTPSVLIVYDLIPERFGFNLNDRDWREKELAIIHARSHICISNQTRNDLLEFYPELDPVLVHVAHCGVDQQVFAPTPPAAQRRLRERLGLHRSFFLLVGTRVQHRGYKNSRLFFEAISQIEEFGSDVLCVGGEAELEPWVTELMPHGCRAARVDLSDEDLALAYGAAEALVYPSLYEGFGMPVIEAMACGCPVITTCRGSLQEVAGGAAYIIGGQSAAEMVQALAAVRMPQTREDLQSRGHERAAKFSWDEFVAALLEAAASVRDASHTQAFTDFYDRWTRLRLIQSAVDVAI